MLAKDEQGYYRCEQAIALDPNNVGGLGFAAAAAAAPDLNTGRESEGCAGGGDGSSCGRSAAVLLPHGSSVARAAQKSVVGDVAHDSGDEVD